MGRTIRFPSLQFSALFMAFPSLPSPKSEWLLLLLLFKKSGLPQFHYFIILQFCSALGSAMVTFQQEKKKGKLWIVDNGICSCTIAILLPTFLPSLFLFLYSMKAPIAQSQSKRNKTEEGEIAFLL